MEKVYKKGKVINETKKRVSQKEIVEIALSCLSEILVDLDIQAIRLKGGYLKKNKNRKFELIIEK